RDTLLVLDGYDENSLSIARLSSLLNTFPRLRILVTARRPRNLDGVRLFPLGPLPVPSVDQQLRGPSDGLFDSVELLLHHVRNVRPDVRLDADNWRILAGICRYLDGLPTALEVAGRRMLVLTPEQLLDQVALDPIAVTSSTDDSSHCFDLA